MKVGLSIKLFRVVFSDSSGFQKQIIVDEDTYNYLCSLPCSKYCHFIAFENRLNEIVERDLKDSIDDLLDVKNWL